MTREDQQIAELVKYFKGNEKTTKEYKLGVEFEHLIVEQDSLNTVSYYGLHGVEETLKEMLSQGWHGDYEENSLIGLHNEGATITLEPGSQLELSTIPRSNIKDIEQAYIHFVNQITPLLKKKNQMLLAIGYQPQTKISDIRFIPKQRYVFMSDYLKTRGKYAHNMMKGTASMQYSLDFSNEADFIKKFKVSSSLAPVMAVVFDNSPFFEGEVWQDHAVRTVLWQNCDDARCGVAAKHSGGWGYGKYAKFVLETPPIFIKKRDSTLYTGDKQYKKIFDPGDYTVSELEHAMTMVFPDVRAKSFIEIRMADACPYPLNIAGAAFWKGLLYSEENVNNLSEIFRHVTVQDIENAKKEAVKKGYEAEISGMTFAELALSLLRWAKNGLPAEERRYLDPLESLIEQRKTPAALTKERLPLGKRQAVQWCFINPIEVD
ncbi:glutamate--cysteine ligase [Desulforamulus aeronauticus]|uniref:Glutamate--cysteine ligase n=1 Tax=Desulforamulus aeronauticus DSM 10349 TaxID=1121421 RepID=A0A1M6UAF4_9FIRM|nr:glutamate-cysteine ligase family protein [Desulforamulus aeronauticus]SHK66222.1 glutamate--cysteine ligase [Desulforamulus aeronauticus DSM 10349]